MEGPLILQFVDVILPVFMIFLSGYLVQKIFRLDIKPISTVAVYLLLPFLVFDTFYTTPLNMSFFYIAVTSTLIMVLLILIGVIVCRLFRYEKAETNAFLLSTIFPNSGNYGIPIILFAFGKAGVADALPLMVFHAILMGVVGIYIAANGRGGAKTALQTVLKQPMNYAIIPAILLQELHIRIPGNFMESIQMISNTSIPLIMIILGMQLANVEVRRMNWGGISLVTVVRLIVSPLIAYAVCLFFPISTLLTNVIIVMAAMPSAANTTLYAIQFNAKPQFVSSCTLITTLASMVTLAVLLNVL
ncbi:AEC family transporter [Sporolactobacillus sp. THM19-2]|uniref:AEC family transporter n=1 Tax=Sporolactobacillus sp. THM19-2 TaxID=2511171 RepID=UPI001F10CFAB|nr:AEC family transporter [Sporolactobacillus sp. THM19-2]